MLTHELASQMLMLGVVFAHHVRSDLCIAKRLIPVVIRSSMERTPPFSSRETNWRAAFNLPCRTSDWNLIQPVFPGSCIWFPDETRCFWMHLPSWRRTSMLPSSNLLDWMIFRFALGMGFCGSRHCITVHAFIAQVQCICLAYFPYASNVLFRCRLTISGYRTCYRRTHRNTGSVSCTQVFVRLPRGQVAAEGWKRIGLGC